MSGAANEVRGEVSLELDGTSFGLRPSYEAIVAIEKQLGRSVVVLSDEAARHVMTLDEAAIITTELARAQAKASGDTLGEKVNARKFGELIMAAKGGLFVVHRTLALVLLGAATGGYDPQGEAQAATAKA